MPRIPVIGLAAVAAVLLHAAPPAAAQTAVKLPRHKVAFARPAGYSAAPRGILSDKIHWAAVGPADAGFRANINLRVQQAPGGTMPAGFVDELAKYVEFNMPAGANYKVISKGNSTVAGERAAVITGSMSVEGHDLRNCQVMVARQGRLYAFTFTCAAEVFETRVRPFLTMLSSVRFLP